MTTYGPTGTIATDAGTNVITFQRAFAATPEQVWNMLTTESGITSWLAPSAAITPGENGSIEFEFDEQNNVTGTITEWSPHTAFAHTWIINGEVASAVRYELSSTADGTELTLTHTQLPDEMVGGYTPGWHAYLVRLDATLAGQAPPEWMDVFQAVAGQYA